MEGDIKTNHGVVETYAEDMAKVIEDDKSGLVKKIIHGAEEHEIEKINLSPESKKNKLEYQSHLHKERLLDKRSIYVPFFQKHVFVFDLVVIR